MNIRKPKNRRLPLWTVLAGTMFFLGGLIVVRWPGLWRIPTAHAWATGPLPPNHQLASADLQPEPWWSVHGDSGSVEKLVGQYLTGAKAKGDPIALADVRRTPLLSIQDGDMALYVLQGDQTPLREVLDVGDSVRPCVLAKAEGQGGGESPRCASAPLGVLAVFQDSAAPWVALHIPPGNPGAVIGFLTGEKRLLLVHRR